MAGIVDAIPGAACAAGENDTGGSAGVHDGIGLGANRIHGEEHPRKNQ